MQASHQHRGVFVDREDALQFIEGCVDESSIDVKDFPRAVDFLRRDRDRAMAPNGVCHTDCRHYLDYSDATTEWIFDGR